MQVLNYPSAEKLSAALKRPQLDAATLRDQVLEIYSAVRSAGDRALLRYTAEFDGIEIDQIAVTADRLAAAAASCPDELRRAIDAARANIERFHAAQRTQFSEIETMPGVAVWRKAVPIERIGLYIPGGTAPLFSTVLMLAVPAAIAGCREIVLCTPPAADGEIAPAIAYAASACGVTKVCTVGGAQAIAAMCIGTESVPAVSKIFGPGNQYVSAAKLLAPEFGVAIDMIAGPSEVMVVADSEADSRFVAADLIAQAEHGRDSQAVLITTSPELLEGVRRALSAQLERLPRRSIAEAALQHAVLALVDSPRAALDAVNRYAPEHLIIDLVDGDKFAAGVVNAGSVFIGRYTPESVGDYASGTNHTLPTAGWAASCGGLALESFLKKITFQRLTREGLMAIAPIVTCMAEAEALRGHAEAVRIRLAAED